MGLAFLTFLPWAGGTDNTTPLLALGGILLLFTIAELLLSPVGLSLSTKLAPEAFRTQMVALNFLSIALGTAAAGSLASTTTPTTRPPTSPSSAAPPSPSVSPWPSPRHSSANS
jgi:POT family proton-dependent oligopeptide transporter